MNSCHCPIRGISACFWKAIAAVVFALVPNVETVGQEKELAILTPHNMHIQREFEAAFEQHLDEPVKVRWVKQGTSELIRLLETADRARPGASFGFDLFFGGGLADHDLAGERGYLEAPSISEHIKDSIPQSVSGCPNYHPSGLWFSTAISSFGILVHKEGLARQGLPVPRTWKDLADPQYFGWLVITDPRKSASVQVAFEAVLQQYGWEEGWQILTRIAANSRLITESSTGVPNEIATGNALAGPCVDFYAKSRIGAAGHSALGFVQPVGGTVVTPDPISMLRSPARRELAEKFISFVMSPEGQCLWLLPAGAPGGPLESTLYRLPIHPRAYENCGDRLGFANPYTPGDAPYTRMDYDLQRTRVVVLAELMGATLVDLHSDAVATWKRLIDAGMPQRALHEWGKIPFEESQLMALARDWEPAERNSRRLVRSWSRWFQDQCETVQVLCK